MPERVDIFQAGERVWVMANDGVVRIYTVQHDGTLTEEHW